MSDIRSKVAYLRGLAEGLEIETTSAEGRILSSMIDVLGDLADQIEDVTFAQEELTEYVEDVDYDLGALEETVFDPDDEEGELVEFVPDEMILTDEDGLEISACPQCGEVLGLSAGVLEEDGVDYWDHTERPD